MSVRNGLVITDSVFKTILEFFPDSFPRIILSNSNHKPQKYLKIQFHQNLVNLLNMSRFKLTFNQNFMKPEHCISQTDSLMLLYHL